MNDLVSNEGHARSQGQKLKFNILSLGGVLYVFGSDFPKNVKMSLEHFWNGPKSDKNENRENAEILVNSVEVAFFGHSKRQN